MTALSVLSPDDALTADVLVVGTRSDERGAIPVAGASVADDLLDGRLVEALRAARAKGTAEEIVTIPVLGGADVTSVLAVGLGSGVDPDPVAVRRGVGTAIRALAGVSTVAVSVGDGTDVALTAAVAEGAAFGAYAYPTYRTGTVTAPVGEVRIRAGADDEHQAAVRRAAILGEAVAVVRDLVNTPAADLYPQVLAERGADLARDVGCKIEILDDEQLRAGGYGGIGGVGRGSAHPPRLLRLRHRPADPVARVALVGKGITFDTGGYNLKLPVPIAMKHDMAGAATAIAVTVAAARLGLPVEVVATVPMAENRVSSTAYLPGDVLRMYGGKTVEIGNTDAEGRLVLADAFVRAAEDEPDCLLECSTLTGGQLVALGQRTAGVLGSDDFRDQVVAAAGEAGESMWPMPLLPELRAGLDSTVADLGNVSGDRYGQMIVAGLFLTEFVADGLPWAHIDMAGPAWNDGSAHGYTPQGRTGYGVASMVRLLETLAAVRGARYGGRGAAPE